MEDDFAAGRPPWDDVGAVFTDRIHDWERYKLRFLNAGHSCIAYLCALAEVTFVHEAMAIPATRTFLEELLRREAMPTVVEIPGHPREPYIASVLERFANPGMHDQIARLCVDGTAKFATFLMPTVARPARGRRADRARRDGARGVGALPRRRRPGRPGVRRQRGRGAPPRRRGPRRSRRVPRVRRRLPARGEGLLALPGAVLAGLSPDRRARPDRGDGA